jgi:hypothetical protein
MVSGTFYSPGFLDGRDGIMWLIQKGFLHVECYFMILCFACLLSVSELLPCILVLGVGGIRSQP